MNISAISKQAVVIDQLRVVLQKRIDARARMSMKAGQACASMTMCGLSFDVTLMNNHYYMPELVKGMEVIHAELIKILDAHVDNARSAVEGAEFRMRELVRGTK